MRRIALVFALCLVPGALSAQTLPSALTDGQRALDAGDYAKAESELAKVKGSGEVDARIGLARAALEQGKFADVESIAAAISAPAYKTKATVLRAQALVAQGRHAQAIKLLEPLKNEKGVDARYGKILLGETLIETGKRDDADEPLKRIIEDYNDDTITRQDAEGLAQVGRAAHLLRSPKDANQAFNESERIDKTRVQTLLWRAELFLDKYDPGHAEEVVREALKIAPKRADALVLMARVKLDQTLDFEDAEKLVKDALAVNPRHTGAFTVRAGLSLRDLDIAGADKAIADGLKVDPENLELLSLKAATRFLDDDLGGFEAQKKSVLAKNPQYSRFFEIVSEYAEWEHRYDDIVAMMKEATKVDPEDGKAWSELGLTQMRSGDEEHGLEAIKKAWSKDKFNVRVFNTLNLYEQQIATKYETGSDGIFKVRYAKDERAVMERYVPRFLGEAWASMKSRYGFVPKVPVQVELYATREAFSVRTSGVPNIGIQGVCFGGVVAAISPKAEPFNWGNVIWHELGHVFAIQLSKNHVPRWFTEGLSEYETIARRPEWARELDPELYQALNENRLPGAVDMNRAFTHADDANDVTVAYYAASQMLVWTVEKFGMPRVRRALELWGQGKKTPDVIQGAFGVSAKDYDAGYRSWQLARLSRYKSQFLFTLKPKDEDDARRALAEKPNDPAAHVVMALSLLQTKKAEEAKKELAAALAIDAKSADAHFVLAKLALGAKDGQAAEGHLDAMRATGKDGFVVRMLLADLAEARKDRDAARYHLEAAYRLDPSQSEPLKGLYDMAKEDKREGDELDVLRKLAALEQHDQKVWRLLLDKLVAAKAWDEAVRIGEGAVFVDVMGAETHTLYAKALAGAGAHDRAVFELETALLCPGGKDAKKQKATTHRLLVEELTVLKRPADAAMHKTEAEKLEGEKSSP